MTDPTTIALAREVLALHGAALSNHAAQHYATLARALLEAQEENERLRGLLSRAEPFVTDARALSLSYDIGIALRPVAPKP